MCYNVGKIIGTDTTGTNSTGQAMGGIAGFGYGEIKNCYNRGEITGSNFLTVGIVANSQSSNVISNCYNIGDITSNRVNVGVVGYLYGTVNHSYTLTPLSINKYNSGTIGEECTALSEGDMKSASFIEKLNEGLETPVWVADTEGINGGYPILSWQLENR